MASTFNVVASFPCSVSKILQSDWLERFLRSRIIRNVPSLFRNPRSTHRFRHKYGSVLTLYVECVLSSELLDSYVYVFSAERHALEIKVIDTNSLAFSNNNQIYIMIKIEFTFQLRISFK